MKTIQTTQFTTRTPTTTYALINFKDYTEKLVSDIFYTYGVKKGTIQAILNIEDIEMNMETAIPLGLIINELVTNSLKFAFPRGKRFNNC